MIPICLSPGDPSASLDQKGIRLPASLHPPTPEMSVPHCPFAITSCGPGSPKQRPASFSREKEIQHIFMRLSVFSCFGLMKERIVSGAQLKHVTPGNGLVLLLSCLREEVYFLARGASDDAARKAVRQDGISRSEK